MMNETQTLMQLFEVDQEMGSYKGVEHSPGWVGGAQGIVGAERRKPPEAIRVSLLEEETC